MTYQPHTVIKSHTPVKVDALGILLRDCKADDYVTPLVQTLSAGVCLGDMHMPEEHAKQL